MIKKKFRVPGATFLRHEKGLAALEFALVLPVMMIMLMGVIEVTNLLNADRRTGNVAATLCDLVARDDSVTEAEIADVFFAAESIMADFDSAPLKMIITSVNQNGANTVVGWSRAKNAAPDATGSTVSDIPNGLLTDGGSVIRVRVTYPYKLLTMGATNYKQSGSGPVMDYDLGASHTINKTFYLRPRLTQQLPEPS